MLELTIIPLKMIELNSENLNKSIYEQRTSEMGVERNSDEIYIMSCTNYINNTKIRDAKMDIKTFVQTVHGMEQWNPLMKGTFPITAEVLRKEVCPAFRVAMEDLTKEIFSYDEFMEIIQQHPDL